MTHIEVEMRGPLSKLDFNRVKDFLEKNGKFKQRKERILIDYSTLIEGENIRNRDIDIRARITNGVPEMIIKLGKWKGSDSRKEISVLLQKGQFFNLLEAFGALGYKKGMLCTRNSLVYNYKNIEFALVEVPGHSYYFEAEITFSSEIETRRAEEKIRKTCKEMGLELFTDKEFFDYIETLNREANEIFDIDKNQERPFRRL